MSEHHHSHQQWGKQQQQQWDMQPENAVSHPVVKAVSAATAGGSLLVLSGLTLVLTVIALTVVTPLFVIFSPVLVPAGIALSLMAAGLATSVGLGVAALSVLTWMYKYMTGKHPPMADQVEDARRRLAAKAREVKDSAQHRVEQVTGGQNRS